MYKIYRKNNYLIINNGVNISEKYLAKDILVQEIVEDISYEIFGILPKLGNFNNQLLHSISIPNIIKEDDSPYTATEWIDFYTVNTGFFFELISGSNSGVIPENQFVDTYSDLPDPSTTIYQIWVAKNSEGSQWLPGSLGGTYYPEGAYVSDGIKWISHKDSYQATQTEVNVGSITNKWVTPNTLLNSSKWNTKQNNRIVNLQSNITTTLDAINFTDYINICTGNNNLTLPTAVTNKNMYTIKVISGSTTVNTTSSQTIDGSSSIIINIPNTSLDFISNDSNWVLI